MTTSPVQHTKPPKSNALNAPSGPSSDRARAISIDNVASLAYLNRNRTPHASASVSAPGGSFFARSTGKAGFQ